MIRIGRRKVLTLLPVVLALIIGSTAVAVYASDDGTENSNGDTVPSASGWLVPDVSGQFNRMGRGMHGGFGRCGLIEVSSEYEETAINIANNDLDVQNLLADGYSVLGVRPIISSIVGADGGVVTKATNAIVMLEKDDSGKAFVSVDIEGGQVTQIRILTITVIDKT